jgi:hypothetical protein
MSIKDIYTTDKNTYSADKFYDFSNEIKNFNVFYKNKLIHLRDQFNYLLTELFKKEKNKDSLKIYKSQLEKKRELEVLIIKEEKRINELKKLKKEKLIKVKFK